MFLFIMHFISKTRIRSWSHQAHQLFASFKFRLSSINLHLYNDIIGTEISSSLVSWCFMKNYHLLLIETFLVSLPKMPFKNVINVRFFIVYTMLLGFFNNISTFRFNCFECFLTFRLV